MSDPDRIDAGGRSGPDCNLRVGFLTVRSRCHQKHTNCLTGPSMLLRSRVTRRLGVCWSSWLSSTSVLVQISSSPDRTTPATAHGSPNKPALSCAGGLTVHKHPGKTLHLAVVRGRPSVGF